MAGQFAADVKVRPLLADTPVGSCLNQDGLLASAATWAVGVMTLTKFASTYGYGRKGRGYKTMGAKKGGNASNQVGELHLLCAMIEAQHCSMLNCTALY